MRCILPTVSKPNWNTMLCGAGPEITGVTGNDWYRENYDRLPPVAMTENHSFPNIFRIIREQRPQAELGSIYHWGDFKSMLDDDLMNKSETYSTELETAQKTAEYILEKKPDFLFIQLDDVDHYGHQDGHMSPEYIIGVEKTDKHVQLIVDAVREAGIADKTLIIVVSDHGGIFHAHGSNAYEELTTPIIFAGKGVKKNYQIQQQIYRYDVPACVTFALGLDAPQIWVGRPVYPAFAGFDEPKNLWKGVEVLPPPEFHSETYFPPFGELVVDKPAEVKIKTPKDVKGEIRYTTDGSTPTAESALYTGPFMVDKPTIVTAKLFGVNGESPRVMAQYRIADTKKGNGLNYAFYHRPGCEEMPSLSAGQPVATGICYEPDLRMPELQALKDQYKKDFGAIFTGKIEIDADDVYTFNIWAQGGYKLYINSELIINKNDLGSDGISGKIRLKKGLYPIRVEFFSKGGSLFYLGYECSKFPLRQIPADKLFQR